LGEEDAVQLASQLPAVVFHTSSIHTTEISTAQVIPELVYNLVSGSSDEVMRILKNTIVLISPSANPDGQVMIKEWYDEHIGTPWEGRMPWLYHPYVGHDNNRDWILLHFPEQRLTAQKIHMEWMPVYSHEMHQMGGNGARLFVPPYQDPHDENTAPEIVETMSVVGMAMSHRLTTDGKSGVVKNAIFDLYTPARAFQIYRGTARILTEMAIANFARKRNLKPGDLRARRGGTGSYDPNKKSWNFPLPWKGGDWTLRTMVEYQISASMAALNLVSADPARFNIGCYRSLKRVVDREAGPYAYVFPPAQKDPSTVGALLQAMQRGGIEIHRSDKPFVADGRLFAKGSHVILLKQPYGDWAKTLLEVQDYPDLRRSPADDPIVPYDVTASTLPLMMQVEAVGIDMQFEAELSRVTNPVFIEGEVQGNGRFGYLMLLNTNDAYTVVDELLDKGLAVEQLNEAISVSGKTFPAGSVFLRPGEDLGDLLSGLAMEKNFIAIGLTKKENNAISNTSVLSNPRIALYEPWGGLMDAGWTRLVLEQFDLEHTTIRNQDVRQGDLSGRFDIILFPDGINTQRLLNDTSKWPEQYLGGIGKEGREALYTFVSEGGTVASFGRTSMAIQEILGLPVADINKGVSSKEYFAPGSLVLIELDEESPLSYGLPSKMSVMNRRSPVLSPVATTGTGPEIVGRYPDYDPRLSGFLLGQERIQGEGAILVQPVEKGRVILYGINPQFRAMTHGAYKLIFNAIFWSARKD
jgi:hypothetical protein